MQVPVELARIAISENSQTQVIWLKEQNGPRSFPILIGIFEAWAIERHVKGQAFLRPLTHDLLAGVLKALKAELKKIVINDIRDGTFYARLVIECDGETLEVDARPSDAIALATRVRCPIFAEEKVIQAVSAPGGMKGTLEGEQNPEDKPWDSEKGEDLDFDAGDADEDKDDE